VESLYGGKVSLESQEGVGTTFTVSIPKGDVPDFAMNAALAPEYREEAKNGKYGGIDLTSDKALTVQNNGQGINFHLDPAQLAQLQNAPGFVPAIINIQPLESLSAFLGIN
jgi:hypothetical protein